MYKITCLFFLTFFLNNARCQFSLGGGGGGGESSGYPRIKLAGPLGQLIGGQGLSLNSGFGQVLSSFLSSAANAANQGSSGGPLSQLATAASTNYLNAIRSNLPFSQFASGNQQQQQQQQQHGQYGAASHQIFNTLPSPMHMLSGDSGMYGGQQGYDNGQHYGANAFQQFNPENYYSGGQFNGYGHGQSNSMPSSALYSNPSSFNPHHASSVQHLDK